MGPNGLPVRKPRVPVTPVAPEAPAASAGTGAETPPQDAAPAAGALPRRKPMATGITEHTGTPATRAEAAAAAAEDGGRRWLRMPNRRAAEPEPETQDADVEHRMPANLSAWLDHRAKLEAARAHLSSASEAAESEGATSGNAGGLQPEAPAAQGSGAMASSPSLFEHASATNHGVQYAPVAEAAQQAPTEAPPQQAWPEAPPQQAWAEVPPQEAQADVAPQAPAAPAAVEEQVSLLPTGLPAAAPAPPACTARTARTRRRPRPHRCSGRRRRPPASVWTRTRRGARCSQYALLVPPGSRRLRRPPPGPRRTPQSSAPWDHPGSRHRMENKWIRRRPPGCRCVAPVATSCRTRLRTPARRRSPPLERAATQKPSVAV